LALETEQMDEQQLIITIEKNLYISAYSFDSLQFFIHCEYRLTEDLGTGAGEVIYIFLDI